VRRAQRVRTGAGLALARTLGALLAILCFGGLDGLPLHIGWPVGAAGTERVNMVDNMARARPAALAS